MAADVAGHLAAARRVPDVNGVVQVEVLNQVGQVVGVVVKVVAVAGLRGAAVPAPVMGDHAVAVVQEEEHLGVPVVRRQGPAVRRRSAGQKPQSLPRHEEYPDQTRAAVIAAARQLFAENGFLDQGRADRQAEPGISSDGVRAVRRQARLAAIAHGQLDAGPGHRRVHQESLAAGDAVLVMQTLSTACLQVTKQWGDVIRVVIDVAPHDDESPAVLATAHRRHDRNLAEICRHLEDIGALRGDVDARLARRVITYYYGIDGLLRTRDVFGWSLERSNEWLLAHACAAVLRSPAEPVSPN